jgi:hypothetical protein
VTELQYEDASNGEGTMTRSRPFTTVAAIIFGLMALAHIYRLFTQFQIIAGSHPIPMWLSYVAIVVTGLLSWGLFRESRS